MAPFNTLTVVVSYPRSTPKPMLIECTYATSMDISDDIHEIMDVFIDINGSTTVKIYERKNLR